MSRHSPKFSLAVCVGMCTGILAGCVHCRWLHRVLRFYKDADQTRGLTRNWASSRQVSWADSRIRFNRTNILTGVIPEQFGDSCFLPFAIHSHHETWTMSHLVDLKSIQSMSVSKYDRTVLTPPRNATCTQGATCTAGTKCENYEMRTECSLSLIHI